MSALRPPVIAGLCRGAGTSTLAAALHARDAGRWVATADVLVCAGDAESLRQAEELMLTTPDPPVLAITCREGSAPPAAGLRDLAQRFGGLVVVPHVPRWQVLPRSTGEAASLLGQPPERLPRPLRAYAAATRRVAAAVVQSGRLELPAVARPRTVELWRGLRYVECRMPAPTVPPARAGRAEPDDDALELAVAAGRAW